MDNYTNSYAPLVNVDDGAYIPGYRGRNGVDAKDEGWLQNEPYKTNKVLYNPAMDEIQDYFSENKYLTSINDLARMENDDISKVQLHHTPTRPDNMDFIEVSGSSGAIDVSMWLVFLIFIAIVFGMSYYEPAPDMTERYPQF